MRVRTVLSFVFSAVLLFACGSSESEPASGGRRADGKECGVGETRECVGPGQCKGAQECNADRTGFDKCDCGDPSTGKGGTGGTDGGSGTGGSSAGTGGTGGSTGTGGAQSSGGSGGSSTGTPGSACDKNGCESCFSCAQSSVCAPKFKAYEGVEGASEYLYCVSTCGSGDSPCFADCEKSYPEAAAAYESYLQCVFCSACPVSCDATMVDSCKQ